jgi:hypothetical protein
MDPRKDTFLIQTAQHSYTVEKYEINTYTITKKGGREVEQLVYMPSTNSWHFTEDSKLTKEEQNQISDSMTNLGQAQGWKI